MAKLGVIIGVCRGCGNEVREGEARYTAMEPRQWWHFECYEQSVTDFNKLQRKVTDGLPGLRRKLDALRRSMGVK